MKTCEKHDERYDETQGDCPECDRERETNRRIQWGLSVVIVLALAAYVWVSANPALFR